ncbi:fimbrial protein [Psychrobacter sanguinis]|uniref:fimbrial protein n=1 Tax=Psychrobacter sanguinis TaxID=861445 RepID=UPI00191A7FD2|nr:fimbrial protein [Psychrobacter sanguinis]MCC3345095.1 type 1 fimbrial protein [Psychrobacter sanguinis]
MGFKQYFLMSAVLIGCSIGATQAAQAACGPSSWRFTTVNINMAIGKVVVKPTDPIGTVLYTKRVDIPASPNTVISCDIFGGKMRAVILNNQGKAMDPNIYKTNVPGIGIRLYRELIGAGEQSSFSGYYPYSADLRAFSSASLGSGFFVIEIIKTSEATGTGSLTQGLYSSYYAEGYADRPALTSTVVGDTITITSSSCEIKGNANKVVQLPTMKNTDFKGVGSTQGEQPFDINILCNGGKNIQTPDKISVSFDYETANNDNRVLKNIAPTNTQAKGVGTQLVSKYNNTDKVIAKGEPLSLGTLNASQTISYTLPMVARYYQTDRVVTAGEVKSIATVTLNYD